MIIYVPDSQLEQKHRKLQFNKFTDIHCNKTLVFYNLLINFLYCSFYLCIENINVFKL